MEYLDLYDENRNLTGEKILRSKDMQIKEGKYINIVIVFIENSKGEFLIQKTSKEKGSIWATTGGFVKSGSTNNVTIVEEIKEELGIDVDINELELVYTQKQEHVFHDTYYMKKDINIDDLTLQKEEVECVKWLSVSEIEELIEKGELRKSNINSFRYIIEHTKKYNKLVRDRIPEIIESKGEKPITRVLNEDEYKTELEKKLYEEYKEVIESNGLDRIEELADMLEVIEALAHLENKTLKDVIEVQKQKRLKRGGFNDKIYLEGVIN